YIDDQIKLCFELLSDLKNDKKANLFISHLLDLSEKYHLRDNLWQSLLLHILVNHENAFTLALERKIKIDPLLETLVKEDFLVLYDLFTYDFSMLEEKKRNVLHHFTPSKPIINSEIAELLQTLQNNLSKCNNYEEFYQILKQHYYTYGVGKYGLNKAFRYETNTIQPIIHIGDNTLSQLIGCESQKKRLTENTEAFLKGKEANNVLLYGDSGTGKSSSIKALLNAYYKDGLRMVEVYKHQFKYLPNIIQELQSRNYKFIIFMDDLSFEDFEIEYKYLKAVIEGGLEKKPDNVLIYATSNRRHLIKQTWTDRQSGDEVSINDAMQEKLSLSSRFGVSILFVHPNKLEYLNIVDGLAKQYGITMDMDTLHEQALTWELRHGGFSGRTAKQFIHALLSK
ncbi:MAG: ATP-binding protein, partial [Coprobacillaceae bacterium]